MTPDKLEELESLLLDWEDGTLDEPGRKRLRDLIRSDDEARAHYVRLQMMNAVMSLDGEAGIPPTATAEAINGVTETVGNAGTQQVHVRSESSSVKPTRWMLTAAALLIGVLAGRLVQVELSSGIDKPDELGGSIITAEERDLTKEATSQGVALITQLVDVEWASDQRPLDVGDALLPGRFAIASGYAQVEFFCGATVILEGPAELDLQSPLLARVRRGRLRAQVPPAARGFSLEVDDMTVVDLGTEFGLSVTDDGANVQVFDGEVELRQPARKTRSLTAGRAVVRHKDGAFEEAVMAPGHFVDIESLESRVQNQQENRFQRWRAWSEEVRRDERLIAYYAFDRKDDRSRRLSNSLEPSNSELDGAIVGANRVSGRWPSKWGLEFKRPGDRVRVQIPGEYSSLTFCCWVKIDSLDRWYNSLFLTDNYNQGEPHWQILDTGQLYFSVRPTEQGDKGPRDHKALSPKFWKPSLSGRWLHLATVYNTAAQSVTHYLNGQVLSRETIPAVQVVTKTRIGTATLGNWSQPTQPDSSFAIRNLNGSMDEFILFAAALTDGEIRGIYDYGRP